MPGGGIYGVASAKAREKAGRRNEGVGPRVGGVLRGTRLSSLGSEQGSPACAEGLVETAPQRPAASLAVAARDPARGREQQADDLRK